MGVDNEGFAAPGSFPPTNPVPPPPAVNPASPGWSADQPYGAPPPPPGPFDAPGAPGAPTASSTSGTSSAPGGPFHPMPPLPGYGGLPPTGSASGSASAPKKRRAGVPVILCVLFVLVAGIVSGVAGDYEFSGGMNANVILLY